MKFAMGTHVLTQLTQKTSHSSDELGALVRQLAAAAAPLEGRFNGAARVAFDEFAHNVDAISAELNAALNDVLAGIQGMDRSFLEGEQTMADSTRATQSSVSFDAARFRSTR
ncbi:WXG100 family type VII secretion target [Jonesia denitrificans]|uniref:WXG100 family type VII secretion target n=1 Tax=Jonesia denitrificans (strain ATCC 14870 / DSM 20603 / BCRC 15368 / CIP 55.134 / JCM 11481 / NBRC 15587 / NCTC 10816 / Prevot 55134) TaxID=471856 RepID=C7R372_JONDD|nr:WXG100 family type VII secretion target [Jonesia denitrificans]ACV10120.1 hypothetical protein Jden_2488 [Jonesia denitrificans DSM 20603]ASE08656.1 hypothetical protein CEP80_05570 [Jonesia denitrificans]QXB43262.1 WXG100 family type VII secretion target [Jonesia denitrificans]SQH23001.1 WXG100 family type VII secretion target [Jonesia denitrificans]